MLTISEDLVIEPPRFIDENVTLGYLTGRKIPSLTLKIGGDACIRSGTIIYAGTSIGARLETGHNVVIREENVIGDGVGIWTNSIIDYGCEIGDNVKIHCNVYIAQYTLIEDNVFLAPGVTIANDMHPLCGLCMKEQAPKIMRGARVGVNVTILPGVVIGEYALIGAGSVVTRSIPPYRVAYGNPAKPVGNVDDFSCPYDRVDHPYVFGLDAKSRM